MSNIVKYKEEDINAVLGALDRLEVKGVNNMNTILGIFKIIQSPIANNKEDVGDENQ